jgi:predicted amidohydrolase YtcJ
MTDALLLNARIHTLDPHRSHATALAVRDGKILAVGTDVEIIAFTRTLPHMERIDLHGRTVLPGLIDAHLHFEWYARGLQAVDAETESLDECLRRVQAKTQSAPKGDWITGHGWNQNNWGGAFPSAADLDRVAPEHPVFLRAKSGHAGWANSLALRMAGVAAGTANPPGGEIQRNARGEPTGILFEDAMELVDHLIPEPGPAELAEMMRAGMENAWRAGLTGIHDFDGRRAFAAFQILKERGQLGLRVVKQIRAAYLGEAIQIGLRSGFGDDWLRIGNVKVFMDGALGPRTARMIEPYDGEPGNYGIVVTDKEELYEQASKAAANGLAMTVHAIGDKANHDLLDVYEKIRAEEAERLSLVVDSQSPPNAPPAMRDARLLRHRCEHVQILHPDDYQRLGQLNVIASMQPIHATSDMPMADKYWGRRSAGAYAWRTQLDAGAALAFGSDAPVESFNPFWGIHAAVTRRRADGSPGPEGWYPEQRVTVAEAVRGFTLGAAYAGYMERRTGSLTPGKLADLVVIDRDIFSCDPMDIKDTQALGTMIGGEWKWRAF